MPAEPIIDFDAIDEHGPQQLRGSWELSAAEIDRDEVANAGTLSIETTVDLGDLAREYTATGMVSFTADLTCARCVEPYPFASNSSFHVTFRPRPEVTGENEEVEITDSEELDIEYYSERRILLKDLALEQVQLSIPMKPLCDEGCLGLCPTCGANRLREECSCETAISDGRWGALRDIRDELAKKKDV